MSGTAEASIKLPFSPPQRSVRKISWPEFQRKYLSREDGYKYEWLNGTVEKSKRGMDKTQLYILRTIQNFFYAQKSQGKVDGNLVSEPDLFFLDNHRRPDISWFTNDQINRVERKMDDYRAAGVQVVWHVFPLLGKVHVYGGEKLSSMQVVAGEQVCSAAPVLAGFELKVEELLRKPELPG